MKKEGPNVLNESKTCARGACDSTDTSYYNSSTRQFYCKKCAEKINEANGPICTLVPIA